MNPNRIKLLFVEDDKADQLLFERFVKKENLAYDFRIASTIEEAKIQLEGDNFDIIVSDYNLGDGTALDLLTTNSQIPVIVVTGAGDEHTAVQAMKMGAYDYLIKSVESSHLVTLSITVENALIRKSAEKKLEQSENLYRSVVKTMSDGLIIVNPKFLITFANESFCTITGLKEEKILNHAFTDLIASGQRIKIKSEIKNCNTGKSVVFESRLLTANNKKRDILVSAAPLFGTDNKPEQYILVLHDITERKRYESALQQARDELEIRVKERTLELENAYQELHKEMEQRKSFEEKYYQSQKMEAIGRLAGGIAHDFNNLLTIIQGYSQLLMAKLMDTDPLYEKINQINLAGTRAETLIRQLLAFSRKQVIQPKVLNLNQVVKEIEKMIRRLIGEDIDLSITLDSKLDAVKMDHGQMEQIIMNIVVNSRDAMPSGGKLSIATKNVHAENSHPLLPAGDYVMMSISDTGIGMEDDIKSHIFEPFFTTKEKGIGTGLGLATVYGIVQQSEGHITAQSERNKGTSIQIYLPRVQVPASVKTETRVALSDIRGSETILIVEDETFLREMIKETLTSFGYSIISASGGQEAIPLCKKHKNKIHLILTDVVMPQMDGREFIEYLKPLHPRTKVLYMSGYTDDDILRHGIRDLETEFIQKPFSPIALVRKIREILDLQK